MNARHELPNTIVATLLWNLLIILLVHILKENFQSKFGITLKHEPRTNNHLEGYNLRLRKCVGNSDPHIYKAITIINFS